MSFSIGKVMYHIVEFSNVWYSIASVLYSSVMWSKGIVLLGRVTLCGGVV